MIPYLETLQVPKLPRTTLQILGLVAVVFLGSAYLIWMNVEDAGAKLTVDKQLQSINRTLQQATQATNPDTAKADLAAAEAQLKDVSIPGEPPSVELVALLVKASKETGVELGNLQVTSVEQEKVGNSSYNVMKQRLQFRGNPSQLAQFMNRVENGGFKSLIANNLSVAPKGNTWEGRVDLYLYSLR